MNFRTRIDDSPGNDVDHWNAADSVYYIEDQTGGGVTMGLASADDSIPINHYYGNPSGVAGAVDPSDEKSLYQSLTVNKVHGSADEITCMVGWEVSAMSDGSTTSLPLVISFGTSYQEILSATIEARNFLAYQNSDLQITEIQDSVSGGDVKVELYNNGLYPVSTSDVYLSPDGSIKWDAGGWSKSPILPGEHVFYSLGVGETFLSTEGAEISLLYSGGLLLDLVSFGQLGYAPDPVTDESIARFWNGVNYSNEWVRDPTPTFGARNDCMGLVYPPPIALKEVFFNANSSNERFIEIYYLGNESISTSGWTLVVDSDYVLPPVTLDATMRHFVLRARDFPSGFDMDDGTSNGDNVYLYDNLGRLADMVGWSSSHSKGFSVARIAFLRFNGFDEASSKYAGWRFDRVPTSEIVKIGPNQSRIVDPGQTAEFQISVDNQGSSPDTFDISYDSSLGWHTVIMDVLGVPIVDNDGDTVPDTDVLPVGEIYHLRVQVSAPPDPHDGNYNTLYMTATSSLDMDVLDTATLLTVAAVPPYVVVNKTANPDTIWLETVTADPRETTITLNVTGAGTPLTQSLPQDVVLVIDNSGSTDITDPNNLRLSGAKTYVDQLVVPDRVATVEFKHWAALVNGRHLSSDYVAVKADIDSLDYPGGGGTYIAEGLRVGLDEMIGYGISSHLQIIILFTDGIDDKTDELIQQAYRAADHGVIVFTIGLMNASQLHLQQVADITGGEFYPTMVPEALEEIYLAIHRKVISLAAKKIHDPIEPNPMIRDALPPYIHFVPDSFRDQDSNPTPPDNITTNSDGSTFLDWDVERLFINQSFVVKYEATSSRGGTVPVGIHLL
ncbi:MAG: VWA domain-containing protein, partial [Methanobacteriota archaeon]